MTEPNFDESELKLHSVYYLDKRFAEDEEKADKEHQRLAKEYYGVDKFVDKSWISPENISEFYRNNRRISFKLCWPVINENDLVYYCALVQLPGKWLASTVRWCEWEQKIFPNPYANNKNPKKNGEEYSSQNHAMDTCYRQLLRKDFEKKYLGKCKYSLTKYKKLNRISIPFDDKFVVIVNVMEEFVKELDKVKKNVSELILDNEDILNFCKKKEEMIKNKNLSGNQILRTFYSSYIKDKEQRNYEFNDVDKWDKTFEENFQIAFKNCFVDNPIINYAAISTFEGIPLRRYEKNMKERNLISYDEFEYFIESILIQKRRGKIEKIFGNVEYTITLYEKLAEISIPINQEFLLVISLKLEESGQLEPPPIQKLLNSIQNKPWSEILANFE